MSIARFRGPGEPNQACDTVATAIVQEYLKRDVDARLNIRVSGGYGALFVTGEVFSTADFDVSAVVRRTLGQCGVHATMEPFIALEPIVSPITKSTASEPITVFGYATNETQDQLPKSVSLARSLGEAIGKARTEDREWFWLGSDYIIYVDIYGGSSRILVEAEYIDAEPLTSVRSRIERFIKERAPNAEILVNQTGLRVRRGLAGSIGSSGQGSSLDQYGSKLPTTPSGVGFHAAHPLNAGAGEARVIAQELVDAKKGRAIVVQASWLPLEEKPYRLSIKNERGEDLSSLIATNRFSIKEMQAASHISIRRSI